MRVVAVILWVVYAYANMFTPNMVSSTCILLLILVYAGFVFYYRKYPGGRSKYARVSKDIYH